MVRSKKYIATPPGATINEQLIDRGISRREFAFRMGMSEKQISKLINGGVELTPETAERLELVLGIPASFWINLERNYKKKIMIIKTEEFMDESTKFNYDKAIKNPYAKELKQQIADKKPIYPFEVFQTEAEGHIFWIAKSTFLKGCVGQGDEKEEAISELAENEKIWSETAAEIGMKIPN